MSELQGAGPPIGITMGDASGVGPDIVLRCAVAGELDGAVVYGDAAILERGRSLLDLDLDVIDLDVIDLDVVDLDVVDLDVIDQPGAGARSVRRPVLRVVDLGILGADDLRPGELDAGAGAAARAYVERATRDALDGRIGAMVTMPMNKEATQLTDPSFVGHTELIADLCGASDVSMMLTDGSVAVTHVSTHCSLREAIERVQVDRVLRVIELTDAALRGSLERPRIAVCGLNPHAGEHGLFGSEDAEQVAPAIQAARDRGIDATGPHPADTVFFQAVRRSRYDAIVCMYHDQGHVPMKLLAFDIAVNVTLGLPIVRTSVDHGTAFDIAWTGTAFTDSLVHALAEARRLVATRSS